MASNLVVMSPPGMVPREASVMNQMFEHGLKCYHARKPDCSMNAVRQLLAGVHTQYHPYIRLHHHHQLAQEFEIGVCDISALPHICSLWLP